MKLLEGTQVNWETFVFCRFILAKHVSLSIPNPSSSCPMSFARRFAVSFSDLKREMAESEAGWHSLGVLIAAPYRK